MDDPESGHLDLESHHIALGIAKKTLDEKRFKHAQKTTDCIPPNFKIGDRVYFKKQATWQMGSKMESWLQDCLYRVQQRILPHRKQSYRKN